MNYSWVGIFWASFFLVYGVGGVAAESTIPADKIISVNTPVNFPVKEENSFTESVRNFFKLSDDYSWNPTNVTTDKNGVYHFRYDQYFKGIKVENSVLILHSHPGSHSKINGVILKLENSSVPNLIPENVVKNKFRNGNILHQKLSPGEIACELIWTWNEAEANFVPAYKMEFFLENSLELQVAYTDAVNGSLISNRTHTCHADAQGTAHTSYHGTQNILTVFQAGSYQLKSTSRGQGIETRNLNQQLNYNSISDFTDPDNNWEITGNPNENFATDAHFSAEKYYDFLFQKFNQNSIDNNGQKLISYLNYGLDLRNAFWNGTAVVYGNGNAAGGPLTTLDIAGHEFTHGLIQKTANLNYSGEPGTINEAIADIFGTALEHFALPQNADWFIGEKSGTTLRNMANPEQYNQPSSYQGVNWYSGNGDNGGVHINSGFINKWFYLLSEGGQGVTGSGTNFSVQGITIHKSIEIVYHSLTSYTVPSTGFTDFMHYTLQSTIDLYGICSPEYLSVLNAWKAVDLYDYTTATTTLSSPSGNVICEGDSTILTATGLPGSMYAWYRNGVLINSGYINSISAFTDGDYTVTESRCGSLFSSNTIHLITVTLPEVTTSSVNVCEGTVAFLNGFPSGGSFSIPNPYVGPATPFTYTYTNSSGCKSSATANIIVHPKPLVSILNTATIFPENIGQILLSGNVAGVFSGFGVTGNYFNPAIVHSGGPYPVYLNYTNAEGCSASDSILFSVIKPCRRDVELISILANEFIANEISITSLNINVSHEDFNFEWVVPESIKLFSGINDSVLAFLTPPTESEIKVNITNTCGETITKTKLIYAAKQKTGFSFSIHPNPANDIIMIETDYSNETFELRIIDAKGSTIQTLNNIRSGQMLNVSLINKGIYNVELHNNKHHSTKKLVIN